MSMLVIAAGSWRLHGNARLHRAAVTCKAIQDGACSSRAEEARAAPGRAASAQLPVRALGRTAGAAEPAAAAAAGGRGGHETCGAAACNTLRRRPRAAAAASLLEPPRGDSAHAPSGSGGARGHS